jgi:hypothetical protein
MIIIKNIAFGFNNFYTSVELRKNLIPRKVIADRYEFGATIAVFIDYGAATSDTFTKILEAQGLGSTGLSLQFEGPWPSIIRLDYGLGFHKNKYVENAIHLEIGHKI